jgi:hypothetical protein
MGEQMLKKRAGSIEVTPSIGVVLLLPSVHESMLLERTLGAFLAGPGDWTEKYTLQRKSHLCIPFLGIARPQS